MIQHSDRNIGPRDYDHLQSNELLITSIFKTIQGEGPYAGCPAVFIRLAGCNRGDKSTMGCQFCDTKFFFDQGKVITFQAITNELKTWLDDRVRLVVITGGEPMIQDNLSAFLYHHRYAFPGCAIQIESNGDRLARNFPIEGWAQVVVSPKIVGKGYHKPRPDVLARAMCFKFVVSDDVFSPYHEIPAWAFLIPRERIYVSPMTIYKSVVAEEQIASAWNSDLVDYEETRKNYKHAAKLALEHGFRVSLQTHLWLELE